MQGVLMAANSLTWHRLPIVSLCEAHVDCVNRTAHVVNEPTPFKMLRTTNVRDGYIDTENVRYVTEETYKKWTRRLVPKRGDIILTREAPLGNVGKIRTDDLVFLGQRLYHFRPDPKRLNADFLLYSFLGDDLQSQIKGFGSGSTVEHMRLEDIPSLELNVPPLPVQQRIASILSAYDDLIENNQRRIKILEEMARSLYREWFVYFRFPGHENHPRVPSPLGEIPKGWEVRKLADFVTTKYGYTESSNTNPVGPKYLRGMDINKNSFIDWSEVPYCPIESQDFDAYRLRIGDVLVIRMADPGKVGIVEQEVAAVFASYLIRVTPKGNRLTPYFLFYLMESAEYYAFITGASTGTTRKSASAGVIAEYQFFLPPQNLVQQFEEKVSEIRSLLNTLLKQTINLRSTRDLLLPRLLSGQIDVEAI